MSVLTDIIISVPLAAVTIFVTLTIALRFFNKALKTASKANVIEQTLQELGLKNFKAADLSASKLDDIGFGRFIYLIRELKAANALGGGTSGGFDAFLGKMQQAAQMQQMAQQSRQVGQVPPQQGPPPVQVITP